MTTTDPELGTVRWCATCEEWWPDDDEFFIPEHRKTGTTVHRSRCRACSYDLREHRRAQNREAQRRHRERVAA